MLLKYHQEHIVHNNNKIIAKPLHYFLILFIKEYIYYKTIPKKLQQIDPDLQQIGYNLQQIDPDLQQIDPDLQQI